MQVITWNRKYEPDNIEWLIKEIGVKDIAELQGMSVTEFMDKYSHKHFSNICLNKLLEMGVVYVPEGELLVNELPVTTRLKNILLRNDVYVLSDIKKYAREEILRFRNLGEGTMHELDEVCEQAGIKITSLKEIEDRMLGMKFTGRQLTNMFHRHVLYPKDFLELTEEDVEYLTQLDSGMIKKIEKMQKLCIVKK